jgi:ABC-2 type transport system ATP-binding protein
MKPMIEVNNIMKNFGSMVALDDVSLSVNKGEIFGLLGPNGAGKSTLINILATLLLPTQGSARIDKFDPTKQLTETRKIIGFNTGYARFSPFLTGWQTLKFYSMIYGVKLNKRLVNQFKLEDVMDKKVETYSSGMLQRLGLVVMLSHKPKVLLLDEPTVGLDPHIAKIVRNNLKKLKSSNTTILLTTHNMHEAEELCNRVAFINHGRILKIGSPNSLKKVGKRKITLEDAFIKLAGEKIE